MAEYNPRYNNFECWFPDGIYRLRGKNPSLIQHLYKILKDSGFNYYYFRHLMGRKHPLWREVTSLVSIVKESKDLSPEQAVRLRELDREMNTIYMDIDELLEPVYHKMRDLGFSHEELIR